MIRPIATKFKTKTWAKCSCCKQEMKPGAGCTIHKTKIRDSKFRRVPHAGPEQCHDCSVNPGQTHHAGCDMERCPRCGYQFLSCPC